MILRTVTNELINLHYVKTIHVATTMTLNRIKLLLHDNTEIIAIDGLREKDADAWIDKLYTAAKNGEAAFDFTGAVQNEEYQWPKLNDKKVA